jgi:VanZ family protein
MLVPGNRHPTVRKTLLRLASGRPAVIFAGLAGFGLVIEMLQGLTTHRSADAADVAADLVGLAAGAAVHRMVAARTGRPG